VCGICNDETKLKKPQGEPSCPASSWRSVPVHRPNTRIHLGRADRCVVDRLVCSGRSHWNHAPGRYRTALERHRRLPRAACGPAAGSAYGDVALDERPRRDRLRRTGDRWGRSHDRVWPDHRGPRHRSRLSPGRTGVESISRRRDPPSRPLPKRRTNPVPAGSQRRPPQPRIQSIHQDRWSAGSLIDQRLDGGGRRQLGWSADRGRSGGQHGRPALFSVKMRNH
jgi:hypothetical protein